MSHLLRNFSLPLMGVYIVFYLLICQLHDSALRIFYTLMLKVPPKHPYMQNQMKLEMEAKIVFGSVCVCVCFFCWRCMGTTAFSRRVLKGLQLCWLQHLRGKKIEHHKKKITLLARCSWDNFVTQAKFPTSFLQQRFYNQPAQPPSSSSLEHPPNRVNQKLRGTVVAPHSADHQINNRNCIR